jgi:hypothetical protein
MEKYKFVKVEAIEPKENSKSVWYFSPSSVEQIKLHWQKYPASVIRDGSRKIANRIFNNLCKKSHSFMRRMNLRT